MSNSSKIKSKSYRNWVRGALGLFYLQEGMYPFTDRVVKAEHGRIVQNLKSCKSCAIENILPAHASGKGCIQKNKAKCNCGKKKNVNCATCSKIYDEIVLQHRFQEPHWVTDCSTWYNDHWQFAKCFMTTTTKGSGNTAADTDASGLLSIIINGKFFQSELQCNINPPNDIFCQVRNIRNEILHNATQELTDKKVTQFVESMIAVLEDKKTLSLDSAAQAATQKLKEILQNELTITISEESDVIQTALDAIREAKEQSEESIRKKAQQHTVDSTAKISAAAERAMEELAFTVSTEFKQTYEPEIRKLRQGQENHENRLTVVEAKQHKLQSKQLELENDVTKLKQYIAKLKNAEEKLQNRNDKLKEKQGLQQHLVNEYKKHKVKTSISPLKTQQNDVNIRDVYVSPRMVVRENEENNDGNTTKAGRDRGTNIKPIERYSDLFGTDEERNRKIFIVGDVGTGKSSFCKMMMQNWCFSIAKRRDSVMEEEEITHETEKDICDMSQFHFLFYLPLREMPEDTDDIVDMIKDQLKRYETLVDDIFTNDSERILILADGLDEWTPPDSKRPTWIPKSSLAGDSTILTTSRPSSRGILKMKSSDCDLKVTLLGLKDKNSVQYMIENYMKLLDKTPDVLAFNDALSNLPFKDIHNAPMLLQQIIWLYCNNHDIGKSRSSVYIHIVNAILWWEHGRHEDGPKLQSGSFKQLSLPKSFEKFPICKRNKELLLLLGKIACYAYITGKHSSLVFGRQQLEEEVSAVDIAAILQTGILTEVNCADPTYEKSQISFIHTSYVEFFAALYIGSRYLSEISDFHPSVTILERLIEVTPETSVTEILRLGNVLVMICGLVPGLTEHVCECIYKLTPSDGDTYENFNLRVQIQDLTSDCLSEHNSVDQETEVKCKLRHLYHHFSPGRLYICFSDLVPTSVETCILWTLTLSHDQCLSLTSFLSRAVSLRTLEIEYIKCIQDVCEGHPFDLANLRELRSIQMSGISVSSINSTCLQSCRISDCKLSHEQYSLLSIFLSQAVSLRTLELDDIKCTNDECEGHTLDLTNLRELQSITMSEISISGINSTCLQSCRISDCKLSHEQSSLLLTSLSQAVSLRTLELDDVECTEKDCEGHPFDRTKLRQIQIIKVLSTSDSGIHCTVHKSDTTTCTYRRISNMANMSKEDKKWRKAFMS